jgi:hypothetical protein
MRFPALPVLAGHLVLDLALLGALHVGHGVPWALLSSIVVGGAIETSRFFLAPSLDEDGRHFGSFGIVLALLAWVLVLTTITTACAVFSPVWTPVAREREARLGTARASLERELTFQPMPRPVGTFEAVRRSRPARSRDGLEAKIVSENLSISRSFSERQPYCHAGGRGFESRRSPQMPEATREPAET